MTHRAYAFRRLWDAGTVVANGSDAPIEELDPLAGIRAGVPAGRRPGTPSRRSRVDEALLATCVNPAPGSATSAAAGSSSRATSPTSSCSTATRYRDLEAAQVVATMVGGRWSFNPPPWD